MNRIARLVRIQLVNAPAVLGLPVLILALVIAANVLIFATVQGARGGDAAANSTGALTAIYAVMLVGHLQTMTQMFPFAVSLSATRRDFFGATVLVVGGQSVLYGVLLAVLAVVERATDGWGVNMTLVTLPLFEQEGPLRQVLAYAAPFLLVSFLGIWFGIVFQRWKQLGVWTLGISFGVVAVGFAAVVNRLDAWSAVGEFFTSQPTLMWQAGYPLLASVVFGAAAYLTARRAVP
ncbi:hypothetical protein [Saccharomonospora iraqiensis]|uniref:hypothetical protein n=1 Tax=Saccharomonospora iraqiensis TaxID=52698 RepID=UPI00022E1C97|nr:hypothetical protein [Saccharomonospora iraqiensis]